MNMKYFQNILFLLIITLSVNSFAAIKVISVQGTAAYKDGQSWTSLRSGMTLAEGTKISTGVRSNAVIDINGNTITVQPLTMIKIQSASSTKDSSTTGIGLKRGSMKASVPREKRVKTVFKVSTPIATSSVRGTDKEVSNGPMRGTRFVYTKGSGEGENKNGSKRGITGKQVFHQKGNNPRPDNMLSDSQKKSVASIFSKNLSDKEDSSIQNNGNDFVDSDNGTLNVFGTITGEKGGQNPKTKVTIDVKWK